MLARATNTGPLADGNPPTRHFLTLLGASFMLLVDVMARSLISVEIPLGVLTAIVGAPVFMVLLHRTHNEGW